MAELPSWAREVIARYESGTAGCFILHGNINDRVLVPANGSARLGRLNDFLLEALLPRFEVVISYELGTGLRVERGAAIVNEWSGAEKLESYPTEPLKAVRFLTNYLIFCRNLKAIRSEAPRVAVVVRQAHLIAPAIPHALNYELNALASLLRSWAADAQLTEHHQAAFLVADHINNLHPLVAGNPRISALQIPLPGEGELREALRVLAKECPEAFAEFRDDPGKPAPRLAGATLASVEVLLKRRQHDRAPLTPGDLGDLKKTLVERDCEGLIEFVEPDRDLEDVIGIDTVKTRLREDLALWREDALQALPMGYLFSGPVGTGKTYLAECLAGEAGVPVVTLRNFRDRWVGSTEANLEKIFALLHALGRCIVFVDEADQALGRRDAGSGDSGVSSRVYSMIAREMSDPDNRGHLLWVLASSRPDLIEIDLKRPGRVDVKIPLFPTTTPAEGFALLRALCRKRGLSVAQDAFKDLKNRIPDLLTPGAAEALAVQCYRLVRIKEVDAVAALRSCLEDYAPPVPLDILRHQMRLAAEESTEASFVPAPIRKLLQEA
ncbi:MAG: ATP-binding protein [Akkermansiaceae bacterium]|nr:ATP-binding protein [Akkermansiaceae bacterium]NNM31326.1 ATP-binding protein [Akkermansiaceae bacterium]